MRPVLLRVESPPTLAELERLAASAVGAGFDGLDLEIVIDNHSGLFWPSSTAQVIALSYACRSVSLAREAGAIAGVLFACDACDTRAKVLSVAIGAVSRTPEEDGRCFQRYQDALNFAYELLHALRLEAEAKGVALALEAPSAGSLISPVELRELIDAANSAAVGACLDVARIRQLGAPPAEWIETLGARVQAIRLSGACSPKEAAATLGACLDAVPLDRPLIADRMT